MIEAWSASRPVVAAAAHGPRELITPEQDGLLVPPEDADALAAAISRVLQDRAFGARLAEAGRARYTAEFAEAPVIARWQAFLHDVGGA